VVGSLEELLGLRRIGDVRHELLDRSMRDDLGALEQLVPPHVVAVLVRVDDALRHAAPDPAEQLDHLAPVRQVGLGVDHHAAAQVDEPRVGVAHAVLVAQDGVPVRADLLESHRESRRL
jgi:hypothetical protein